MDGINWDRFWQKIRKEECWIWTGAKRNGYGIYGNRNFKTKRVHRIIHELLIGPLRDDEVVMHKCDNPICCNPAHLQKGTQAENLKDMRDKKRHFVPHARGEEQHLSVLTEKDVLEIRRSSKSPRELSDQYGVHHNTIRQVLKRITWKHV